SLINPLPASVSYVGGSARSTSGNVPSYDGATLAWNGSVNAGGRVTITYQAAVKSLAEAARWNDVITNGVTVNDPLALQPATLVVTNPVAAPIYTLSTVKASVADGGSAILPGQPYTYVVNVVNSGALAGLAQVNATLGASASYLAGSATTTSGAQPTFNGTGMVWNGSIGAGQKVTLTYQYVVNASNGLFSHTLSISDTQLDVPAVKLAVNPIATPQYRDSTLTASKLSVSVGERYTYTLVIRNGGKVNSAHSYAEVLLPPGLSPAGAPVATSGVAQWGTASDTGTPVQWNGSVPSGGSISIDIPVIATSLCGSQIKVGAFISDAVLPAALAVNAPLVQTYSSLILNEDFNGSAFPPVGWSLYRNSGNCDFTSANWYNHTGGQQGYAYANSNGCGANTTMDTELRSPVFSLAGIDAPMLQFRSEYYQYTSKSQYGAVDISTAGSAGPWTTLWKRQTDDRGPKLYQIDLKPYAGLTSLMVRFHFYNQSRTWWWQVDDIVLYQVCPLSIGTDQQATACRGKTINYTLNVSNNTATADTVNLSYYMPGNGVWTGWPVSIQHSSITLTPYGVSSVNVSVAVPWVDMNGSQSGDLVITALGANSGLSAQATLRTTVGACGGWISQAPSPVAAADAGLAYFNGSLYQIGGRADRSYLPMNGVYRYDIAANSWQAMSSIPVAVDGIDAVVLGGQIYVVGGETNAQAGTQTTLVQVYDPAFDRWSTVAPLPQPLAFYEAQSLNGRLYVIGGYSSGASTSTLYIYDPLTNAWTNGAPLRYARRFAASGVINGKLYVAGGYDGSRTLDSLEVYSPNPDGTGSWADGPAMPRATDSSAGGVLAGRYLVVAGGWSGQPVTNRVQAFDVQSGVWMDLPAMLSRRMGARADGDGTRLFAVGGYDVSGGDSSSSARNESISVCPTCSAADAPQGTLLLAASPLQLQAGTPVSLSAVIADPSLLSFDWDFGDGIVASGTSRTVSHSYATAGAYTVAVTARNACGAVRATTVVNASPYGVTLNPATLNRTVSAGTTAPVIRMAVAATSITYTLRITNSGVVSDQFVFSVSNNAGWSVVLSTGTLVTLAPGQGTDVIASVNMPLQQLTSVNVTTITATSTTSNLAVAQSTLKTWIQPYIYYLPIFQR
ncbi:MAG TPA: kelch repeat-containing protein, partial [Anaerolineae bacterium]